MHGLVSRERWKTCDLFSIIIVMLQDRLFPCIKRFRRSNRILDIGNIGNHSLPPLTSSFSVLILSSATLMPFELPDDKVATAVGTGIGLAFAKSLAEAHQGDLRLEDNVGGYLVGRKVFC